MARANVLLGVVVVTLTVAMACTPTASDAPPGTVIPGPETLALANSLQQQGAQVTLAEVMPPSSHPYFRMPAARYLVDAESVYAFEYESAPAAAAEASRISADGSLIGTTQVSWTAAPHFYLSDRVVVLYVGERDKTLGRLRAVLGAQIAGR